MLRRVRIRSAGVFVRFQLNQQPNGESNMAKVKPIPDGYHSITPYLIIKGAQKALDFYAKAFGAEETFKMPGPDGTIGHAEMRIGNSMFMLADENPKMGHKSATTLGGSPMGILLYVDNVDEVFQRAVDAGATVERPIANQFYGDRTGGVKDPFGFSWYISTHIEDVTPEEMQRRAQQMAPA